MNEENKEPVTEVVSESDKKKGRRKVPIFIGLLLLAGVVSFIYTSDKDIFTIEKETSSSETLTNEITENNIIALSSPQYDVVEVVRFVSRSVFSINVTSPNIGTLDVGNTVAGAGSGIIFSEDDESIYIVTNYHVVQNANTITVSMDDGNEVASHYIGGNQQSDLAVIAVAKTDLTNAGVNDYAIANLGNSEQLEVGEYVVAIGNALGEGKTVTDGIISAKNKQINLGEIQLTVLQTNAAINEGNSGGPLSNMNGEVIGINTAKLTKAGVEGMGYSIPINDAKLVIDNIMQNKDSNSNDANIDISDQENGANGEIQFGVKGITVTYDMMIQYNFPAQGVYVVETIAGSNASNAGLQLGDIIVGFESAKITTVEELATELLNYSSGDSVKVYVYRSGATTPVRLMVILS